MLLFEHDPYTGYERLTRRTPDFMDQFYEAQEVWKAEGIEFDRLRPFVSKAVNDCIISIATEEGIAQWEDFLNIAYSVEGAGIENESAPQEPPDLDFRRAMVAAAFLGNHHIGRPEIIEICNLFTNSAHSEVDFNSGTVSILIDGYLSDERAFLQLLRKKLPAHLGIKPTVRITRTFRAPIPLAHSGTVYTHLEGDMLPANVQGRSNIDLTTRADSSSDVTAQPAAPDVRARADLAAAATGSLSTTLRGEPAAADVTKRSALLAQSLGWAESDTAADMPQVQRETNAEQGIISHANISTRKQADIADSSRQMSRQGSARSGAFIYVTRTSKRIREEE